MLRQREQELEAVRNEQKKAAETEAKLRSEIEAIGEDRRKLNQALIDAAARGRATEDRIAETESRLAPLDASELRACARRSPTAAKPSSRCWPRCSGSAGTRRRRSWSVRRTRCRAVRTAIMLGAVLPEMRSPGRRSSAADLAELRAHPQEDRRGERRARAATSRRSMARAAAISAS